MCLCALGHLQKGGFYFIHAFFLLPSLSFSTLSSYYLYMQPVCLSIFIFNLHQPVFLSSTKLRDSERTMIKLRTMRFSRSSSKLSSGNRTPPPSEKDCRSMSEIKWELRPGGMLVQKRDISQNAGEGLITVRVSTVSHWHDISIKATSTFGELKMILSLITKMEPREQRVLFKGKERDDEEYLHMVGVRDKDKVLLLQDPAIKEQKKKLLGLAGRRSQPINTSCHTISVYD